MRSYAAVLLLAASALLQGCGGTLYANPGWRALEGYSQPRIELPED